MITSSSAILELDSDQFTCSSDDNASSGFTLVLQAQLPLNHLVENGSLLLLLLSNLPAILFLVKLLVTAEIEYGTAQYANGRAQ